MYEWNADILGTFGLGFSRRFLVFQYVSRNLRSMSYLTIFTKKFHHRCLTGFLTHLKISRKAQVTMIFFAKIGRHTVCNTTNITKGLCHRYFNGNFFEAALLQNSVIGTSGQMTQSVFSCSKSIIKTVGGVKAVLC